MLPDSMNVRQMSENILDLQRQIKNLDSEIPSHPATDVGKILKVDSDGDLVWDDEYSYTPPAYSSTAEVNTGQKWIDGKDIYCKVFTGEYPADNTAVIIGNISNLDSLVELDILSESAAGIKYYIPGINSAITETGDIRVVAGTTSLYSRPVTAIVYYTKTPATRSDDLEQVDKGTGMIIGEDPEPFEENVEEAKETKSRKKSNK